MAIASSACCLFEGDHTGGRGEVFKRSSHPGVGGVDTLELNGGKGHSMVKTKGDYNTV